MNDEAFPSSSLRPVTDTRCVEHVHGPDDGRFLPICRNGVRPNGMYVAVNQRIGNNIWRCIAKQWVPA